MRIYELQPDVELSSILPTFISVDGKAISAYADNNKPINSYPNDFIIVQHNGVFKCVTQDMTVYEGYLVMSICCKLNSDSTIKRNKLQKIMQQIDSKASGITSSHYFYTFNMSNPITPTTANINSGYSVTRLNVKWRTLQSTTN